MTISEINAKSLLRKRKKVDSWFISCYGMNIYRGCSHNCIYCDGRAEKYNVDGEFGEDVVAKVNANQLLRRELDPRRKRIPLKKCYVLLGGGVGDCYQPVEDKYQLSRKALQAIYDFNFPVHVLTKSTLVKRDIDILKKINEKNRTIVSMSFSSVDEKISAIVEPGVPSPDKRLEVLKSFKNEGLHCGMFLMPVIPFITDTPEQLEMSVKKARDNGIDFIIFSGMTLKEGRQKDYFLTKLSEHYPNLEEEYLHIFRGDRWGGAISEYSTYIHQLFFNIAQKYKMPVRIPYSLFNDMLSKNDLVMIMLEHMDYLLRSKGFKSPYGYAAYSISQLKEPLTSMKYNLRKIKGVGKITERFIREILNTGSSKYYDRMLNGGIY